MLSCGVWIGGRGSVIVNDLHTSDLGDCLTFRSEGRSQLGGCGFQFIHVLCLSSLVDRALV